MRTKIYGLILLVSLFFCVLSPLAAQDEENSADALQTALDTYWKQDINNAFDLFDAILKEDPDNVTALAYRGYMFALKGRFADSEADFAHALEVDPDTAIIYSFRALVSLSGSDVKTAGEDLQKALLLNVDSALVSYHLANFYIYMGDDPHAIESLTFAIQADKEDIKAFSSMLYFVRGALYKRDADQQEKALDDLSKALEFWPENFSALASRGDLYALRGEFEPALEDLNASLDLQPYNVFALSKRGDVYRLIYQYEIALVDLNRALDLQPDDPFSLATRGLVYANLGEIEQGIKDLNRALTLDPQNSYTLSMRGDVFSQMGEYDKALKDLNQALRINPVEVSALSFRGDIYRMQGKLDLALTDLTMALSLRPHDIFVLGNRGDVYRQMGEYDKALEDLTLALEFEPEEQFALVMRGLTYFQMKRYDDALPDLEKAVELNPNDAFAQKTLESVKAAIEEK